MTLYHDGIYKNEDGLNALSRRATEFALQGQIFVNCPSCKARLNSDGKKNKVKCPHCSYEFCFNCKEKVC